MILVSSFLKHEIYRTTFLNDPNIEVAYQNNKLVLQAIYLK